MNPPCVHEALVSYGRTWQGLGTVVEIGAFLGGSSLPLLAGLKAVGYNEAYWAFDRWRADTDESLMPAFVRNMAKLHSNIILMCGETKETIGQYDGGPIEICLLNETKREPFFTHIMLTLSRFFIPGVTLIGLMDYHLYRDFVIDEEDLLHKSSKWFIESKPQSFKEIKNFGKESSVAFFRYLGESEK
jgi:hypothetical protein